MNSPPELPRRLTESLPGLFEPLGGSGLYHLHPLAGDASNRQYFRAHGGSNSYVLMLLAESGFNSPAEEITKVSRTVKELPFIDVQRYLQLQGVKVPGLVGYDEKRGVLLLEDYGDALLYNAVTSDPLLIPALYQAALDQLEKIAWINPSGPRQCVAFARAFDRDLYNWEFDHFVEWALDKRLAKPPTDASRKRIVDGLHSMTNEFLTWDNVFCHRDYHSKNLLVLNTQPAELGVIDFQDALLAPLFYDLASLLRDSYLELPEPLQDSLVEGYRLRMKSKGYKATDSKAAFRRAFDWMGTHRNLKAAGRFFYIEKVKGNPRYLQYVPRSLSYVEKTLRQYPELKSLADELCPLFDEIKSTCPA